MKRHLPPLVCWTFLWLLFFAPLLWGQARLPNSDFSGQFHAFALFQAEQMGHGRLPLWSPGSIGGFPFAADVQAAAFYLPRWLTIAAASPWGFPFYALEVEGLGHLWLAGVFTYALAWHITGRRAAALLGAVAFALGGYLTSYPLLQLAVLETITWLPLALLLLRRGLQSPTGAESPFKLVKGREGLPPASPLVWLLAAGVVLGLAFLAGHPQTFLHTAYVAAAYYLFLAIRARWAWRWVLGMGALVGGTAVGVAAILILPAAYYLPLTTRSDTGYAFAASGQPLLLNIQAITPRVLAVWAPEYIGLVAVTLALFAWFGRRLVPDRAAEIAFWAGLALAAAWVALGDKGILFELFYHTVPGFSFFRQQERLMGVVSLALALLAAQGSGLWLQLRQDARLALLLRKTAVTLALILCLSAIILAAAQAFLVEQWPFIWLRAVGLAAITLALLARGRRRGTVWLLVLLLAVDLHDPILQAMDLQPESPAVFWPQPDWLAAVQADNPGRIDSRSLFHANAGEIYGLEDIRGLSPLQWQAAGRFHTLPRPLRWQLLHVTHVLEQSPIEPTLTEIAAFTESILPGEKQNAFVYRFTEALPRAWMVYQPLLAGDSQAAFELMRAESFDPATQVVLTAVPADLEAIKLPNSPAQVAVTMPHHTVRSIAVSTTAPGILVISEWAQPGWQATINNQSVPLLTVNYALQGVFLPAGNHVVALHYRLPGLRLGAAITAVTFLVVLLLAWRWRPVPVIDHVAARPLPVRYSVIGYRLPFTDHRSPITITVLLLLAFALRLYTAATQELRAAEAASYLEAGPAVRAWASLVGHTELGLRLLSIFLSMLLLPLVCRMGRQFGAKGQGRWLGLLAMAFTAVSPLLIWASQDVWGGMAWEWRAGIDQPPTQLPELAQSLVAMGQTLVVGEGVGAGYGRWLFMLAVCLVSYGAACWRRVRPQWVSFLLLWLGGALLGAYLIALRQTAPAAAALYLAAPAWYLLLAAAIVGRHCSFVIYPPLAGIGSRITDHGSWIMALLLFLASLAGLHSYYTQPGRSQGTRALAAHIHQTMTPGDVVVSAAPDPALAYYLGDAPAPMPVEVRELAQVNGRIWFVPDDNAAESGGRWLAENALREWDILFGQRRLQAYRPAGALAQVLQPLGQTVEQGEVTLRGTFVAVNGRPVPLSASIPLHPGDTVAVTLVWEARQPVAEHLTVFVHLLAADGMLLAQHDGVPADGRRPTNEWQPGDMIIDTHTLVVPAGSAPGTLHLVAGLYHTETLTQQLFRDGHDTVPLRTMPFQDINHLGK